jgi:hypothetical protein
LGYDGRLCGRTPPNLRQGLRHQEFLGILNLRFGRWTQPVLNRHPWLISTFPSHPGWGLLFYDKMSRSSKCLRKSRRPEGAFVYNLPSLRYGVPLQLPLTTYRMHCSNCIYPIMASRRSNCLHHVTMVSWGPVSFCERRKSTCTRVPSKFANIIFVANFQLLSTDVCGPAYIVLKRNASRSKPHQRS